MPDGPFFPTATPTTPARGRGHGHGHGHGRPCLNAVTSSTRQLYAILRCVGFIARAQVQVSSDGIRVSVEDSRVMQAHAFLDRKLFSAFAFHPPPPPPQAPQASQASQALQAAGAGNNDNDNSNNSDNENNNNNNDNDNDNNPDTVTFTISLSALLECLQLFGADAAAAATTRGGRAGSVGLGGSGFGFGSGGGGGGPGHIFDQQALRTAGGGGTCRLVYEGRGRPLCVTLEDPPTTTTTCHLTTYVPLHIPDIPLRRDSLTLKIIMPSSWLYDALLEHLTASPSQLVLSASPRPPYFTLTSNSPLGSTAISFSRSQLETFQVAEPVSHMYNFNLIRHAVKAMAGAYKVSIRGDAVGVLSLQFMIAGEGGGEALGGQAPSFVEFKFMPLGSEAGTEDEGGEDT